MLYLFITHEEINMFTDAGHIKKFIEAGNSTITIQSEVTGNRYTYRIKKTNPLADNYFVSLMVGPDNERSYEYIGMYTSISGIFFTTRASKHNDQSIPVKAFKFFCNSVKKDNIPPTLSVYHEGRCGKCNRKLTTPESIKSGFGPECIKRM